ncbi:MAG: hypothetical protein H7268_06505, partial [Sandarakinorhabdus sp.]|nr:hypothetical protein [Sandarakinorhabdus sp.]
MRRDRRFRFTGSRIPAGHVTTGAPHRPALMLGGAATTARQRIGSGASRSALAVILLAQPMVTAPLLAAGFAGTPTTAFGSVTYNRAAPLTETITLNSAQATINWTPTDTGVGGGAINFLPNGNSASFVTSLGATTPVTVLNRIIAADQSRAIAFNGLVTSQPNVGVWFYAPGGILVGSTARFNVGSLLLTASDPVRDAGGNFIQGGNKFSLSAATQAGAGVDIAAGAQINAVTSGSYVIAVAPHVTQAGAINVNGSAALVAADAVDFTMNAGLFDISVTQGTSSSGQVMSHTGTTTGAAATAGQNHRIYLVAVPKNDAITLFVGGGTSLGFDIAGAADVVGNTVVLSAGHNVAGTAAGDPFSDTPASAPMADIYMDGGSFTSALTARASHDARLDVIGTSNFASNLSLRAANEVRVSKNSGSAGAAALNVTGNLLLSAETRFVSLATQQDRVGGLAGIIADPNFTVSVGGNAAISADGVGDIGSGGKGTGGAAYLDAYGGSVSITGTLAVHADGIGAFTPSTLAAAGAGTGGNARVDANDSGTNQGQITVSGGALVSATGQGGANDFANGADGTGGTAETRVTSGGAINFNSGVTIDTTGADGATTGGIGGTGRGGTANLLGTNGTVTIFTGGAAAIAHGIGGSAVTTGSGGAAFGGSAVASASTGGTINNIGTGYFLQALANGGSGDNITGTGGSAVGGTAILQASGGLVQMGFGNAAIDTTAAGGSGFIGGNATGGNASIQASGTGTVTINDPFVVATASASAFGGNAVTTAGSATGG